MINPVSSNVGVNFTQAGSTRHVVTPEQKNTIETILAKFDASSLSQNDAQEISDTFKDIAIRPSRDLREIIEASGFDADEIRELSSNSTDKGGMQKTPPPLKDDSEELSVFEEYLAQLLDTSLNKDEITTSKTLEDYTSRYSNLTDTAKDKVKDLLSQLTSGNEELKSSKSNLVMNELDNMLHKNENYNRVEVYV